MKLFFKKLIAHIRADIYCICHMFSKPVVQKITAWNETGTTHISVGEWTWDNTDDWKLTLRIYRQYYPEYKKCDVIYHYGPPK